MSEPCYPVGNVERMTAAELLDTTSGSFNGINGFEKDEAAVAEFLGNIPWHIPDKTFEELLKHLVKSWEWKVTGFPYDGWNVFLDSWV